MKYSTLRKMAQNHEKVAQSTQKQNKKAIFAVD